FSTGNPALKPERSQSLELGIEQQLGRRQVLSVTGFTQRFRDVIEYAYGGGPPTPDFQNISSAHASGIEAQWRGEIAPRLAVSANYTWLKTVAGDSGSDPYVFAKGQALIRRPASSAGMSAEWNGRIGARATYVGRRDDVTFV